MSQLESISLDDTIDGRILSEQPSDEPGQAVFIGTPNSSVNFGGGFEICFLGGVFRTSNKELIDILTKLSKRGTGIHRLDSVESVAAAKQADPVLAVSKESAKEGAAAAAADAAAKAAGQ
jgi:hypothetical protein